MDDEILNNAEIKSSENDSKEDFLHCINLENLKKEVSLDLDGIAKIVSMKNPKGLYKWSKYQFDSGTRPSYNALIKLLKAGATVETLFGVEYKGQAKPSVNGDQIQPETDKIHIDYQDPKFQELVEKALVRIEERKKQGIIK